MAEASIHLEDFEQVKQLFGSFDEHVNLIQQGLGVSVVNRDCEIKIYGEEPGLSRAVRTFQGLQRLLEKKEPVDAQTVRYVMGLSQSDDAMTQVEQLSGFSVICLTSTGKPVKPKTMGQKKYIDLMKNNTVVFGIGPAGTGKTYLAMAMAITAFKNNEVNRIILTRPAIEAGEKLGFLPGDLQQKVDPYLRPLYDALYEIMGVENFTKNMEKGLIEVAPLAYMRGRTLDNAYIVLDEAQNTTPEQMKMFLTRIGYGSKAVITGDLTQIDLAEGKRSGLLEATKILSGIEGIGMITLTNKDVVRHPLVQKIILAYEKFESRKRSDADGKKDSRWGRA